jgi:hypothetical protein
MSLAEELNADQLVKLAQTSYSKELSPIEVEILQASCRFEDPREWTSFASLPPRKLLDDQGRPFEDASERVVRSAFLRWLLTNPEAVSLLEQRGLRLRHAVFNEPLDLRGCRASLRLEFRYCRFSQNINLISADILSLYVMDSYFVGAIEASRLTLHGPLFFSRVEVQGRILLDHARIDAEMSMKDTTVKVSRGEALILNQAHIGGAMLFNTQFRAMGTIQMIDTIVGGQINFSNASIQSVEEVAGTTTNALLLDQSTIHGSAFFNGMKVLSGRLSLRGTKVDGAVEINRARFFTTGSAITAELCEVHGAVTLVDGFRSKGEVLFQGASVGAFICKRGTVRRNLNLELINIKGHLLLSDGFKCFGTVNLLQANIEGHVNCQWSFIRSLLAENARIGGNLLWRGISHPEKTQLNLVRARVNTIYDEKESWPPSLGLRLNGLMVQGLQLYSHPSRPIDKAQPFANKNLPFKASDRIEWLNLQPKAELVESQPWIHVAQLLEQNGRKRDARRVVRELRRHQIRANWSGRILRPLGALWEQTIADLEEQPLKIVFPILICIAIGSVIFTLGRSQFIPTKAATVSSKGPDAVPEPGYPRFQPIVYATENVLPVIKLGQDEHWAPNPNQNATHYWILAITRWFLIFAGWAQGLILVSAVSGRFRSSN